MSDLEEGLDQYQTGGAVDDFDVEEAAAPPVEPVTVKAVAGFCQTHKSAMQFFGFFGCLFFLLFFLSLLLILAVPREHVEQANWTSYRLPAFQRPVSYSINMTIDVEAGTVHGLETIRLELFNATDFIVIHAAEQIKIRRVLLRRTPVVTPRPAGGDGSSADHNMMLRSAGSLEARAGVYPAQRMLCNATLQQCILQWSELLEWTGGGRVGDVLLGIEWESPLNTDMRGAYRSTYREGASTQQMVATQFEATDARAAFPCFDEPGLKAVFRLTIMSDASRSVVLGNMPVMRSALHGALLETEFEPTPPMSTYLVAYVVSSMQYEEERDTLDIPVRVYSRPEVKANGKYAAEIGAKIIKAFNGLFGQPYPLPKMDMVAVPDFNAGAMENWGLMTFRETALLYDERHSSSAAQQRVATVVAHELAHQWFGDLVTMKWWKDVWLNEGFATFVEYEGVDRVHPEWRMWDSFVSSDLNGALYADSLSSTHAVSKEGVETPADIGGLFGSIIYSKGGSLLRMLQMWCEKDAQNSFFSGLRLYVATHRMSNAETSDLWNALSEQVKFDVAAMMDTWTKQPGYPVVTPYEESGRLHFRQQRFVRNAGENHLYAVPIVCVLSPLLEYGVLLTEESGRLTPDVQWHDTDFILVNKDRLGFYRVAYTPDMVGRLLEDLNQTARPALQSSADAIGLINDLYHFTLSSQQSHVRVDVHQLLDYARIMVSRFEYSVAVSSAVGMLSRLGERAQREQAMHAVLQNVISPLLDRIGMTVRPGDSHNDKLMRSTLAHWAVTIGSPQGQSLLADFDRIKAGEYVHPDVRVACYQAAMALETDQVKLMANFDWLLRFYQSTGGSSSDRVSALMAIPRSSDKAVLERALSIALDESLVRQQETTSLLVRVAISDPHLGWAFIKTHYAELEERYKHHLFTFVSLIENVAGLFKTVADRRDVEQFLKGHNFDVARLQGILEEIDASTRWESLYGAAVGAWIDQQ